MSHSATAVGRIHISHRTPILIYFPSGPGHTHWLRGKTQNVDNHPHRRRQVDFHRIGRHYRQHPVAPRRIRLHGLHQPGNHCSSLFFLAYKHSDIPRCVSCRQLAVNFLQHPVELQLLHLIFRQLPPGRGRQELHFHIPPRLPVSLSHLLNQSGISGADRISVEPPLHIARHGIEKRVVKPDHIGRTPPVAVLGNIHPLQRQRIGETAPHEFLHTAPQQFRVGITEPVDALLLVADNQVVMPAAEAFKHERLQVLPLHLRRVLELVNKVMLYGGAHPLIDKRGLILAYDAAQKVVGVGKQQRVVVAPVLIEKTVHLAEQPHIERPTVQKPIKPFLFNISRNNVKRFFQSILKLCRRLGLSLETFGRIRHHRFPASGKFIRQLPPGNLLHGISHMVIYHAVAHLECAPAAFNNRLLHRGKSVGRGDSLREPHNPVGVG